IDVAICGELAAGYTPVKRNVMRETPFENLPDDIPITPIEMLERAIASLPPGEPARAQLLDLRGALLEHEGMLSEAREAIEKMEQIIKKVTSPANRIGTFLGTPNKERSEERRVGKEGK